MSEDCGGNYKKHSPSATPFLASVRIKDAFPIFTTYFGDWKQLKNKGETPEPLAHPISCRVEFESRLGPKTMGIYEIKLVHKATC